ncbi:ImmA/IrrE family metallo-endopeptidase [Niallia taxi]|uniref:ImmA/IrrE family metallo-endopeptidase n=1 Tax=Niallia taxi TaxID=2499688 RepID=UPI00254E8828|nr:ImmA/IrrE family metallo-endopeptidase [Niallia taxi]MDK8641302.1 ImmA/IrrE family metallo-endopeptidase [Niallia taxi]
MANYIKKKVESLTKKYKTNNPYELAEHLGFNILLWDLHPDILGFYKYEKKTKWIVINENSAEQERYFTCGHELGHGVFHTRLNTPYLRSDTIFSVNRFEKEANSFAVELMIPDELWTNFVRNYTPISEISKITGIPEEILNLKTVKKMGGENYARWR